MRSRARPVAWLVASLRTAAGIVFVTWTLAAARPVGAMTADGTLITNVACMTYMGADGAGYSVSFCMTSCVWTWNPAVMLQKIATPSFQASGGVLTFRMWVINATQFCSVFNLVLMDRLAGNVSMGAADGDWNGGSGGTWAASNGPDGTSWSAGLPPAGQVAPHYLRWALDVLGRSRSAFVSYTVTMQ